jgi:hypothetical protein
LELIIYVTIFILCFFGACAFSVFIHEFGHFFFAIINKVEIRYFVLSVNFPVLKHLPKLSFEFKKIKFFFSPIIGSGFVEGNFLNISLSKLRIIILGALILEIISFFIINSIFGFFDLNYSSYNLNQFIYYISTDYSSIGLVKFSALLFLYTFNSFIVLSIMINILLPILLYFFRFEFLRITDGTQFINSFFIKDTKSLYSNDNEFSSLIKLKVLLPIKEQEEYLKYINRVYGPKKPFK